MFEDCRGEQGDDREAPIGAIPPWLEAGLRDMHPTVRLAAVTTAYRQGRIDSATARALLEMQCTRRGWSVQDDRENEMAEAEALARLAERERIASWLLERSKRADTMGALIALRKAAVELAEGGS